MVTVENEKLKPLFFCLISCVCVEHKYFEEVILRGSSLVDDLIKG